MGVAPMPGVGHKIAGHQPLFLDDGQLVLAHGLGVDDAKHGFTVDELALVMAAFDTHPEAGK